MFTEAKADFVGRNTDENVEHEGADGIGQISEATGSAEVTESAMIDDEKENDEHVEADKADKTDPLTNNNIQQPNAVQVKPIEQANQPLQFDPFVRTRDIPFRAGHRRRSI